MNEPVCERGDECEAARSGRLMHNDSVLSRENVNNKVTATTITVHARLNKEENE